MEKWRCQIGHWKGVLDSVEWSKLEIDVLEVVYIKMVLEIIIT